MRACWFCREPVTEPDPSQQMAVARAAAAFAGPPPPVQPSRAQPLPSPPVVVTTQEPERVVVQEPPVEAPVVHEPLRAPVAYAPEPVVLARRDPRRVRWGRVVVLGLAGAVVLTVGALAYESVWTGYLPPDAKDVSLVRGSYPDVGCAVGRPDGWTVQQTKRRVTVLSGELAKDRSTRGFRIARTDIPADHVEDQIEQLPDRLGSYNAIETYADSVDGVAATVHVFVADDLRFEQWWVARGKHTLRIDLWSRPADERAADLNQRIVDSVELL